MRKSMTLLSSTVVIFSIAAGAAPAADAVTVTKASFPAIQQITDLEAQAFGAQVAVIRGAREDLEFTLKQSVFRECAADQTTDCDSVAAYLTTIIAQYVWGIHRVNEDIIADMTTIVKAQRLPTQLDIKALNTAVDQANDVFSVSNLEQAVNINVVRTQEKKASAVLATTIANVRLLLSDAEATSSRRLSQTRAQLASLQAFARKNRITK